MLDEEIEDLKSVNLSGNCLPNETCIEIQGSQTPGQFNIEPDGRSRNRLSSSENSITQPQPEAQMMNESSKGLLQGASTVTDDQIARKAHSVLEDFFTNGSMENVVLDLKEWLHASTVSIFINECLMHVLERTRKERRSTGTLLKEMVRRKLFTTPQVLKGFELVLQAAEDLLVDVLKLWLHLAQMVEPIFEEDAVNIGFLGELAGILIPAMAQSFVAATLKELVFAQGGLDGAERIWITSNASLSSILPGVDVTVFVDQQKELEFIQVDSTSRSTNATEKLGAATTSAMMYPEVQRCLEFNNQEN